MRTERYYCSTIASLHMIEGLPEVSIYYRDENNLASPFDRQLHKLLTRGKKVELSVRKFAVASGIELLVVRIGAHPYAIFAAGLLPKFPDLLQLLFRTNTVLKSICKCKVSLESFD